VSSDHPGDKGLLIECHADVRGIDLDLRTVTLKIGGDPSVARSVLRQLVQTLGHHELALRITLR
jgi:hypothetical protein